MRTYLGWPIDFAQPAGEPSFSPPGGMAWRVFKNPVALAVGGVAAVLMEFAEPRIRTGVWEHSSFRRDPIGRSRRTGMAAMIGVYGPQSAAKRVIAGITNMHAKVSGATPSGEPYQALDPDLLAWVSATAGYGFVTAYDRFVEPLSEAEVTRFFEDGNAVSRLYGVENPVRTRTGFDALRRRMEPGFEPHEIVFEFLEIVRSGEAARLVPGRLKRTLAGAAVSILPPKIRDVLQIGPDFDMSARGERALKALARISDRVPLPGSPPADAARRLGLPWTFAWKRPEDQAHLLALREENTGRARLTTR